MSKISITRNDQIFTTKDVMEFCGAFQRVTTEASSSDVGARSGKIQFFQSSAEFLGFVSVIVVASKLHPGKTYLRDLRQRGIEVLLAIIPHRIELHGYARI